MYRCFLTEPSEFCRTVMQQQWGVCPKGGEHVFFQVIDDTPMDSQEALILAKTREIVCKHCGEHATTFDAYVFVEQAVRRMDTGDIRWDVLDFGVGAMWFDTWNSFTLKGDPQIHYGMDWSNQFTPTLHVLTPGGEWNLDSRANNCTKPQDTVHRCWCRHGEAPLITCDKVGNTCSAGQGSIRVGNYHGFLRNGILIPA